MEVEGVTTVVSGRAEIDTRAPFRSVKEAVVLFGEKVLAGELHAGAGRRLATSSSSSHQLQNRAGTTPAAAWAAINQQFAEPAAATACVVPATAELEEAKHELEKEREEKQKMAGCILSLQEELSNAMRELKKLKARGDDGEAAAKVIDLLVEDLKFVEVDKQQQQRQSPTTPVTAAAGSASPGEFQKRRYVTFADPPTAAYGAPPQAPDLVMELHHHNNSAPAPAQYREVRFLQRQMSAGHEAAAAAMKAAAAEQAEARRRKKKPLIPLVGALFMRKKKTSRSGSSSSHDDSALSSRSTTSFF